MLRAKTKKIYDYISIKSNLFLLMCVLRGQRVAECGCWGTKPGSSVRAVGAFNSFISLGHYFWGRCSCILLRFLCVYMHIYIVLECLPCRDQKALETPGTAIMEVGIACSYREGNPGLQQKQVFSTVEGFSSLHRTPSPPFCFLIQGFFV